MRNALRAMAGLLAAATIVTAGCGGGGGGGGTSDGAGGASAAQRSAKQAADASQVPLASAQLNAPPLPSDTDWLNWVESNYAQFFPSRQDTRVDPPYTYRYYPTTKNYVGIAGDSLYALGPVSNGGLLYAGHRTEFGCRVYPNYCTTLSGSYLPRLRGTHIAENMDWTTPTSSRWKNLPGLVAMGPNVVRIMLDQYSPADGAPLLPGQPLSARMGASLATFGGLVDYLLANNVHVVFALNTYFQYPAVHNWPDDGRSTWTSASAQQEIVDAWAAMANRYKGRPGVIFDLMNEPHGLSAAETDNDSALVRTQWNALVQRLVATVSQIDAERWMLVEPLWGKSFYLKDLVPPANKKVFYSVHYYEPHFFTHQGVGGDWPAQDSVHYPGVTKDNTFSTAQNWNRQALAAELQLAKDFATKNKVRMMVGETGVILQAPLADRLVWATDVVEIAESLGFDMIWFNWQGWGVPSDYRFGWSWENSLLEPLLKSHFRLNLDPATRS